MLTLPDAIVALLVPFATLFTSPTWRKAQLCCGAILGSGTVAAALRVMGRSDQRDYDHETGRCGRPAIAGAADGWWRDWASTRPSVAAPRSGRGPSTATVRSSRSQVVKASGLRWISLMWLGHVPWAGRHWALPTVLAPSTRYYQQQGRQHEAHRLGPPDGHATAPLAAPPTPGAGGRQQLCRAGFAPLLPVPP